MTPYRRTIIHAFDEELPAAVTEWSDLVIAIYPDGSSETTKNDHSAGDVLDFLATTPAILTNGPGL